MKEKGFTLIEILGTLVILGVLMLLISPLVLQSINRFRNDSYESQVRAIEVAASDFASDYLVLIPLNDGQTVYVTVGDLKADGYLDKKLKNPKTDKLFPNDAIVTITKKENNYTVKFDATSGTESLNSDLSKENAPVITLTGDKITQILVNYGYVEPGYVGSISGVKVTYKKGKDTVSQDELKKNGVYTVYYELTRDGITQVITRTVVVGEYSSNETPVPSPTPEVCNLLSVEGKSENGISWKGAELINHSSSNGEYDAAGTDAIFKGHFIGGKSIRIYFMAIDGYTVQPNMQKVLTLDDGTEVPVQGNTSGPTMAYIDFTLPKTVSQFHFPLYLYGSGSKPGDSIVKLTMQCS